MHLHTLHALHSSCGCYLFSRVVLPGENTLRTEIQGQFEYLHRHKMILTFQDRMVVFVKKNGRQPTRPCRVTHRVPHGRRACANKQRSAAQHAAYRSCWVSRVATLQQAGCTTVCTAAVVVPFWACAPRMKTHDVKFCCINHNIKGCLHFRIKWQSTCKRRQDNAPTHARTFHENRRAVGMLNPKRDKK